MPDGMSTIPRIKKAFEAGNTVDPENLVILCHGYGSNGADLISLAPYFAHAMDGKTVFVSPNAPFGCEMAPEIPNMFQWFPLIDRGEEAMLEGAEMAAPILEAFIDEQRAKYGIAADKTALVGFSQGTMMSLYVGPRYKDALAGVLGYSGRLLGEAQGNKIPVCLIHGEADNVVSVEAYHQAKEMLEKEGFEVSGHTSPNLAHSINENGIKSGSAFLEAILYK